MLGAPALFNVTAAIVLLAVSVNAEAQQQSRVYRVGFLTLLAASPEPPTLSAFKQGLKDLGYEEGKNVVIDARFAAGLEGACPNSSRRFSLPNRMCS